jgi:hypothetical protein
MLDAWRIGAWAPSAWRDHAWAETDPPVVAEVVALAKGYYADKLRLPGDVFVMQFSGDVPAWVALNDGKTPVGSIGYGTEHRQVRTFECADESARILDGYHGVKIRTKHGWRMA